MYKRKNYGLILGILFICLLTLSIGLASLSSTLTINGLATANGAKWDIHFTSITKTGGSTGATGNPGTIVGGTSIENLQASLPLRGTYVEFTAVIKNEGDFPAFLNYYHLNTNLTCSGGTETENKNVCDYITVTVSGVGSGDLTTFPRMNGSLYNEPLAVNATRTIKIRVDYDKNNQVTADKLVNKAITINNINLTIQYSYGTGTQSDANIVNAIKTSSTGSIVTLNNTVGKKIDSFTLYGNTSQNGTPTPTNPVPVNVVTGNNVVKVNGKNLWNSAETYSNATNFTPIENGFRGDVRKFLNASISLADFVGKTITISCYVAPSDTKKVRIVSQINGQTISGNNVDNIYGGYAEITVTPLTNNDYARISYGSDASTIEVTNLQIEYGNTRTSYEIYRGETTYNLNLSSIELAQIDDAQDSITYEGGKWYLNKQVGKVVLNGTEDWTLRNTTGEGMKTYSTSTSLNYKLINTTPSISNLYSYNGTVTGVTKNYELGLGYSLYYQQNSSSTYLYINSNYDLAQFRTNLSNNNMIIYYILDTPTKTQITDTIVVNSLNSIKNINTLAGTTTISISGTSVNPSIQVRY